MKSDREALRTCIDIYNNPLKKLKTVGIILDATKPYKTEKSYDYVTKLKVIDETLHSKTKELNHDKKYLHIFIYSKSLEEAPLISKIGDIIYLKRYNFEIYNEDPNEVKGKKHAAYSLYYIFDGAGDNLDVISTDSIGDYTPNGILEDRIFKLRKWSFDYFSKNSLSSESWFGLREIDFNKIFQGDFDMLLKIKSKIPTNISSITTYEFTDGKKNPFYLQNPNHQEFAVGDVIKIRSILKIEPNRKMQTNTYSSLMKIPNYFLDFKKFKDIEYSVLFDKDTISTEKYELYDFSSNQFDAKDNKNIFG